MPSSKRVTGNLNFWTGNSQVYTYADLSTGFANTSVRRGASDTALYSSNLEVYGNIVSHGYVYGNGYYLTGVGNGGGSSGGGLSIPSVHFDVTSNGVGQTFSNVNLGYYLNDVEAMSVYINGAYQSVGNYSISGTTLTISSGLVSGDSVDVGPSGGAYGNTNVQDYLLTYTGNISFAGAGANIFANYYYPNGAPFTGSGTSYSNTNVQNYLPTYTGNLAQSSDIIALYANAAAQGVAINSLRGNITGANTNIGLANAAIANLQNLQYSNANVANYLASNANVTITTQGNITTSANLQGNYVLGNGAFLTGISGGGSDYSNANVANYLPVYNGPILANTANVTGVATFSNVANLRVPGGANGQYLQTDGTGNVAFANVAATPGGESGTVQYNYQGTELRGVPGFTYDYTTTQQIQISNTVVSIFNDNVAAGSQQLIVAGNIQLAERPVGGGGFLNIGSIDGIAPGDLVNAAYTDQFVIVEGSSFNYANAVRSVVSGSSSNIIVGGSNVNVTINIAASNVTADTYGNASQVGTFTVGTDGRLTAASNASISLSQGISDGSNNSTLTVPTQTLTIAGTTNRVTSSLSGQIFTLSAPQDLHTGALFQVSGLGAGTAASAGEVRATGNIIAFFSDDRLKTRLGNIEGALDKLDAISTFYFEPNETAVKLGYPTGRYIGVSAQDTEQQVPEIVADAPLGEGYLTVMYEKFAPLLIAAIKELRAEINDIKKKL